MNAIENFRIESGKSKLTWKLNGKAYEKQFILAVNSAIELSDKSGFAIVGSYEEFGKLNAMIFNADGTLRAQLLIAESLKGTICFHEIYYVNQELTGIIASNCFDYACVIDETSGVCGKPHETR